MAQPKDCDNLSVCTFFRTYGDDERYRRAVSGFILLYCQGERQDRCVRKDVGMKLGGSRKVPANMLPNGLPLTGTDDSSWSEDVKGVVGRHRAGP